MRPEFHQIALKKNQYKLSTPPEEQRRR